MPSKFTSNRPIAPSRYPTPRPFSNLLLCFLISSVSNYLTFIIVSTPFFLNAALDPLPLAAIFPYLPLLPFRLIRFLPKLGLTLSFRRKRSAASRPSCPAPGPATPPSSSPSPTPRSPSSRARTARYLPHNTPASSFLIRAVFHSSSPSFPKFIHACLALGL